MNRNVHRQVAEQRGVDIRNPSTAYFTIDSDDAYYNSTKGDFNGTFTANNFRISRSQSLIPGFFTRMAVQEVVMRWALPNISAVYNGVANTSVGVTAINVFNSPLETGYTVDVSGNTYFEGTLTPLNSYNGSPNIPIIDVDGVPTRVENLPILDPAGAPVDISGASVLGESFVVNIPDDFYNVEQALRQIVLEMNASVSSATTVYSLVAAPITNVVLNCKKSAVDTNFTLNVSQLALALGFGSYINVPSNNIFPVNPNLMFAHYVDIASPELTSQQRVKDCSTNINPKDILYRWNFGWSCAPPTRDGFGFPILQGYTPFTERREIGFPKQIAWDPLLSVGHISFQSYLGIPQTGFYGFVPLETFPNITLLNSTVFSGGYSFNMNLLLSEV